MSHLFVLERMTAHLIMRGRNKFAAPPLVLCSILLFHKGIITQMEERCNIFITCLCLERSERNELNYELNYEKSFFKNSRAFFGRRTDDGRNPVNSKGGNGNAQYISGN